MPYRIGFAALEFYEAPQTGRLNSRFAKVKPLWRIVVKRMRLTVKKPLARRVQLLEDVFDKPNLSIDPASAIVLPTHFQGHLTLCVFTGNAPSKVPPQVGVHCMEVHTGWIGPTRSPRRRNCVGGVTVEVLGGWVEVGVPSHDLPLSIDEDLLGF